MKPSRYALWMLFAAAPCTAAPTAIDRWLFGPPPADGLVESRELLSLGELAGEWRQLHGAEADRTVPELYPRQPEARLVRVQGQDAFQLELQAHRSRALVVSAPRPRAALPRYALRAAADLSGLGGARASLRVRHLRAARAGGWVTLAEEEAIAWSRSSAAAAVVEGLAPESSTHISLAILLDCQHAAGLSRLRVSSLEIEGRSGLRWHAPGAPVAFAGTPLRLAVSLEGAPRGRSLLSWSCRSLAAGAPAREVTPGEREAWAAAGRAARWQLEVPTAGLEPGGYLIELDASDADLVRHSARLECLVLPGSEAPRVPALRRLLSQAEARLGALELTALDPAAPLDSKRWCFELRGQGLGPDGLGVSCGIPPPDWPGARSWVILAREAAVAGDQQDWLLWGPKNP